eukprot:TRINITY_DN72871_c0_g1_i1.p1 TRINITY_DN72871_c0_g1~~TRINITY_DN72871_c0_g1_i1.p1  ORF type:complete len:417 (-),score=50.50 TRINITY_DN72871_c0_g1_i1:371-1621(-)
MSGEYRKHNTNGGLTIGDRTTPQTFSYFTFIKSGRRLMIVDIQGVCDLYTDPVVHFLPSQVSGALQNADGCMNFCLRGFALFLWSHRYNDIDRLLQLPVFALSHHELKYITPARTSTVCGLFESAKVSTRRTDGEKETLHSGTSNQIQLEDISGVDLSDWCDWRVALPEDDFCAKPNRQISDFDMVEAECHMEIASMYQDGRINLRSDESKGEPGEHEIESAVFHVVEAARQDLLEALLALARLASDRGHADFLPEVTSSSSSPVVERRHRDVCLALLARAAAQGSSVAMASLARIILDGDYCERGSQELQIAALLLEAFADLSFDDAMKQKAIEDKKLTRGDDESESDEEEDREQEHSSLHGETFGWEDHGWTPQSALIRAIGLWKNDLFQAGEYGKAKLQKLTSKLATIQNVSG